MKIIVGIKRVIDYEVDIQVNNDNSGVIDSGVPMAINPFDEVALEEAIKLKESGIATHIIAISLGNNDSQDILRNALAMGADEALLIQTDSADIEPLTVANALSTLAKETQADLILLGKQAIDNDANQTGQMTAALLDCGQAVFVSQLKIDTENKLAIATRDTDFGTEKLELPLPAVITAALRLNEPRFLSLPQIIKAKKQTINVRPISDFGIDSTNPKLQVINIREPEPRKPVVMLNSVEELAEVINKTVDKI